MVGVVKVVPENKDDPPVAFAYQLITAVPLLATADKLTVPAPHLLLGVTEAIVGTELIVISKVENPNT